VCIVLFDPDALTQFYGRIRTGTNLFKRFTRTIDGDEILERGIVVPTLAIDDAGYTIIIRDVAEPSPVDPYVIVTNETDASGSPRRLGCPSRVGGRSRARVPHRGSRPSRTSGRSPKPTTDSKRSRTWRTPERADASAQRISSTRRATSSAATPIAAARRPVSRSAIKTRIACRRRSPANHCRRVGRSSAAVICPRSIGRRAR
jgi:hypothetical protein